MWRIDAWPVLGLPAFFIVCFLVFCLRAAIYGPGPGPAPLAGQPAGSPWLPRLLIEFGYWMYRIPLRIFLRLHISANMITAASLVLTVAAAVAVAGGRFSLGGWTLLLAFTCDAWDGMVARATGKGSATGAFIDATVDRYSDLVCFLGFLYYYRDDLVPLLLIMAALVGSTLVSYTRAKGAALGVDPHVGYMQRYERAVWLGSGTVLAPFVSAWLEPGAPHPRFHLVIAVMAVLAVLTHITAIWRIRHVMAGLTGPAGPDT